MGFFTLSSGRWSRPEGYGRNPFQGGMGFFTLKGEDGKVRFFNTSQSLSGWDGVFHVLGEVLQAGAEVRRNPFQGGMGFFTSLQGGKDEEDSSGGVAIPFRVGWGFSRGDEGGACGEVQGTVAIPFRVGWGFSPKNRKSLGGLGPRRNPFQGGMGFFTSYGLDRKTARVETRRNPFQGGMGFFTLKVGLFSLGLGIVAIPFRVGWGFSQAEV